MLVAKTFIIKTSSSTKWRYKLAVEAEATAATALTAKFVFAIPRIDLF